MKSKYRHKTFTKTCRYCGKEYQTYSGTSFACPADACQMRRRNEWRWKRNGSKPMEARPCFFCGQSFMPKTKTANKRQFCYRPECEALSNKRYTRVRRDLGKLWREARKLEPKPPARRCAICGKPLPPNRHFRHDHCVESSPRRLDGDWPYFTWDMEAT